MNIYYLQQQLLHFTRQIKVVSTSIPSTLSCYVMKGKKYCVKTRVNTSVMLYYLEVLTRVFDVIYIYINIHVAERWT